MNILLKTAVILCLSVSLFSCSKDDDSNNSKSKTQFLTQASWILTNSESGTGGVFTSDWSSIDACEKDDITTFKTDKTFQTVDGASKCDPLDPDIIDSGTWNFSSGETQIIVNSLAGTIVTLNDNTMVLTFSLGAFGDYRATYGH